ncbi:MAG: dienelactone hydrolase family protein [Pseudomonadota bacterium]
MYETLNTLGFRQVSLPSGGRSYRRAGAEQAPILILFPAIAGLNDYIFQRASALWNDGFDVCVVDYFAREERPPDVSTPASIGEAVAGLADQQVLRDAKEILNVVNTDDRSVGAIGFCIGGMYAYMCAAQDFGLLAAVDYYGQIKYDSVSENKPRDPFDMVAELNAPVLFHFGDFDRLISHDDIDAFRSSLLEKGAAFEMQTYSGAPHAFDEDFRPQSYRPAASAEAWSHSRAFLNWYLKHDPVRV